MSCFVFEVVVLVLFTFSIIFCVIVAHYMRRMNDLMAGMAKMQKDIVAGAHAKDFLNTMSHEIRFAFIFCILRSIFYLFVINW